MTARTLLHFCEPLVLRGRLAVDGMSELTMSSSEFEVVEVVQAATLALPLTLGDLEKP